MSSLTSHPANMAKTAQPTRFSKNLRAARDNLDWSLEQAAEAIGTSKGYLSELERGLRPMPPGKKLAEIADALLVPLEALVGAEGARPATVPVVGYVKAGAEAVLYAEGQGPFDYVPAPEGATEKTVAVEIRGESLGEFFDEWLVFYDDVHSPITPDQLGQLCVVGLPDGRVLVKKIRPAREPGLYHLLSQTEGPILDQEVAWAARVKHMSPR